MIHEDASSFNTQWKSGKFSHSKKVLTADVAITKNGSIVNVFDPNGGNWNVTMPPLEAGRFYAVAHIGTSGTITIKAATGATISVLDSSGDATLFFASESEWTGMSSSLNLTDFGYTGAGHHSGLVPDPGVGPAQAPPNLRFLSELGWSTVVGLAVSNDYFKGHKGGAVTLTPLGSETLEFLSANTAITILANSGTTPKSIGFTLNAGNISHDALAGYVADQHVAHSGVTLTAGLGISGGGTIAASRTFDFAPSELTVNGAPVAGDYLVMDLAAGGPRRTLVSTLGSIINHNALLNYVANEHINHANVSMVAGMGLSGGGDITTSRSFAVNFEEFTTDTPSGNDFIPFFDSSDGLHKKTLVSNVGGGGGGGSGGSQGWMTDAPPTTALSGDLWWETDTGYLFVYYDDGSSAQWVSALPSAAGGSLTEAPTDTLVYGRKDGAWARSVAVAGDTMTGTLTIAKTGGNLLLAGFDPAAAQPLIGFHGGASSGAVMLGMNVTWSSANSFNGRIAGDWWTLGNAAGTGSYTVALATGTGAAGASANYTANLRLTVTNTGVVGIPTNIASNSTTTGSLTVAGGVGVAGALVVAGQGAFGNTVINAPDKLSISSGAAADTSLGFYQAGVRAWSLGMMSGSATFRLAPNTVGSAPFFTVDTVGNTGIPGTTVSSSTTTGALVVGGGIGAGGNINAGGTVSAVGGLSTPSVITATGLSHTFGAGGTAATVTVLLLNGGQAVGAAGSQIAFRRNSANVFTIGHYAALSGGSTDDFTIYNWINTKHAIRITATDSAVNIASTTASTSTTTGALTVVGGVGIGGALSVGGVTTTKIREVITAGRTYYVDSVLGNDSNTGLAAGASAFASLQKAMDVIASLDCSIYNVIASVADGTYAPLILKSYVGSGTVTFTSASMVPANCIITGAAAAILNQSKGCEFIIQGFKLVSTGAQDIRVSGSTKVSFNTIDFGGTGASYRAWIDQFAQVFILGTNTVSHGGAASLGLFLIEAHAYLYINSATFTFSAATTYSTTLTARDLGLVSANSATTFPGSAVTATRYSVTRNAAVGTFGATQIAGSVAGATTTGGQYA